MKPHEDKDLLLFLVDGLKKAASAANGLAHTQANPAWLTIRDLLENVRTNALIMATSKSVSRQNVLQMLDSRAGGQKKKLLIN